MYFTGLTITNSLILQIKQFEELMQSEFGTELLISKQRKRESSKLQTVTPGEGARDLLVDIFYDDVVAILN